VIFDRNAPDARLIGIEYIVSEERFRALPDDEKRLWHSHRYEVKSGTLAAPGIPERAGGRLRPGRVPARQLTTWPRALPPPRTRSSATRPAVASRSYSGPEREPRSVRMKRFFTERTVVSPIRQAGVMNWLNEPVSLAAAFNPRREPSFYRLLP
jgi:Protein of unknown function (DUF1264)